MTERVHPPVSATLRFWRAWCREFGGTLKVVHRNPRGVIRIEQGGMSHVYRFDKYGKDDGKYSWSSSFPVDFMARCVSAEMAAHPDDGKYEA